jgi:hypothetical protein
MMLGLWDSHMNYNRKMIKVNALIASFHGAVSSDKETFVIEPEGSSSSSFALD